MVWPWLEATMPSRRGEAEFVVDQPEAGAGSKALTDLSLTSTTKAV